MQQENTTNMNMIKSLKEKREFALQEIKKLTVQLDMVKNNQNPSTIHKINEIQNLFDKVDKYN